MGVTDHNLFRRSYCARSKVNRSRVHLHPANSFRVNHIADMHMDVQVDMNVDIHPEKMLGTGSLTMQSV